MPQTVTGDRDLSPEGRTWGLWNLELARLGESVGPPRVHRGPSDRDHGDLLFCAHSGSPISSATP
jgi:hypothetical protein